MMTFIEWMKRNRKVDISKETELNGEFFAYHGLPMVVKCACCEMSMTLPSALLNDDSTVFCSSCAGE